MAENKKSFLMYCDLIDTVKELTDEQAGKLFKHTLDYVNDLDPKTDDPIIKILFPQIKNHLKRDLKKWENIANRNRVNGLKGGRPPNPEKPKEPTGLSGNPEEPKKAVSVIVSDTVSVTDSVIVNGNVKEKKKKETIGEEIKSSLHVDLKNIFLLFYKKKTGEEYYWTAKDGASLKQLISKTKKKLREKEIKETDEKLCESLNLLFTMIKDKWILANLSIPIINSKFNEIIQNGKQQQGITEDSIRDFLAGTS